MGRFHRHRDGTVHEHDHDDHHDHDHSHEHHDHDRHGSRDVGDHSGYDTGVERVQVLETILDENDRLAAANRTALTANDVHMVNVMSSPGAGKTSLLRRVIPHLADHGIRVGVLEGDIATSIDADALTGIGATAVALVNTSAGFGGECHLDAVMVQSGLTRLPLGDLDLIVIENVGNLVCPAEFDVGQHRRAMVYAITEGEEKPLKYPVMFHAVDAVFVNKIDLLPHLDFDLDAFYRNLSDVNPDVEVIETSARTGVGIDEIARWLAPVTV